jgi:polar amino acid transport system permease protein
MNWDWQFAWNCIPTLLDGLRVTVVVSLLATGIALVVGLCIAIGRNSRVRFVAPVLRFVVDFLRGTPLLIQLFFLFYVLPTWGLTMSPFVTGLIGLSLPASAYMSEAYRAGIASVPTGQWEAATVLGLPRRDVWVKVIVPQAIRPVVPALTNYAILMFKNSAILSVITVNELLRQGLTIGSDTFRYIEPLTLVGLFYLVISYPLSLGVRRMERRLA